MLIANTDVATSHSSRGRTHRRIRSGPSTHAWQPPSSNAFMNQRYFNELSGQGRHRRTSFPTCRRTRSGRQTRALDRSRTTVKALDRLDDHRRSEYAIEMERQEDIEVDDIVTGRYAEVRMTRSSIVDIQSAHSKKSSRRWVTARDIRHLRTQRSIIRRFGADGMGSGSSSSTALLRPLLGRRAGAGDRVGPKRCRGRNADIWVPVPMGRHRSTKGLDCSGLVQRVYGDMGISAASHGRTQANMGTPVASLAQAQPGDLVAFGSPVDHIGIYIGNGTDGRCAQDRRRCESRRACTRRQPRYAASFRAPTVHLPAVSLDSLCECCTPWPLRQFFNFRLTSGTYQVNTIRYSAPQAVEVRHFADFACRRCEARIRIQCQRTERRRGSRPHAVDAGNSHRSGRQSV